MHPGSIGYKHWINLKWDLFEKESIVNGIYLKRESFRMPIILIRIKLGKKIFQGMFFIYDELIISNRKLILWKEYWWMIQTSGLD